ncbi:MAG: BamA/TamA family outer membrane protein [Gemmatimonadales bacterium]
MRSILAGSSLCKSRLGTFGVIAAALICLGVARPVAAQLQQPLVIRALKFQGNKSIDVEFLATSIRTTNSASFARLPLIRSLGLGEKRYFDERDFQADVLRLGILYKRSGFPDVVVDTVVERSRESVKLTFRITEGEPIRISRLDVTGIDTLADASTLRRDLPVAEGDPFSEFALIAAADTLGTRLLNAGYPTASVDLVFGTADTARHLRTAELHAEPGRRAVYGDTRVVGYSRIDSSFIASLVTAREGNTYRYRDVFRSQRSLYGSELFRLATVGIDTARFTPGDSIVPMLVTVTEGRFHRARASAGYGTIDCLRAGAGWTARNFLGNGRVLDVSGRLSKIGVGDPLGFGLERSLCSPLANDSIGSRRVNYGLNTSIRRNGFLSPDNTGVLAVFVERRSEFNVYEREELGASITITRETAARVPITVSYRAAYGQTRASDASFCAFFNACAGTDIVELRQRRWLTTLSLNATRQRVNNILDPTRGSTISAGVTLASKLLGSSNVQQFTRVVAEAARYVPLTRSIVLATHVRGGYIFAPRSTLGGGSNFIPPDQRFYAGGPNDVRGYDRNELGPVVYVVPRDSIIPPTDSIPLGFRERDARPAATGGNKVVVANVELRLPSPVFSNRMRFAVFVDAGAVGDSRSASEIRITPGAGVRFASPLGPIRFDIGYNRYRLARGPVYTTSPEGDLILIRENFSRDNTGGRWTLHFSVGQAF